MHLANPTAAAFPTAIYTQRLNAASADLGQVRDATLDTQVKVDGALARLHSASASIHDALTGASSLPTHIPGGAVSYVREASASIGSAVQELSRFIEGRPVDVAGVHEDVRSAIARLTSAVGLITHPPSNEVYDGS